jgi:hypothetical protein
MTIAERLRREGREQGRKQQQREALRKLLSGRFGPLPEPALDRIRRAGLEQLDRWFDRGISADSLDAVFAKEGTMTMAERLRREGFEQGFEIGCQQALLERLLSRRFGPLPRPVLNRIRRAGLEKLDRWYRRSISADSLDAVFEDKP